MENTGAYRLIEQFVVPYIARIVAGTLNFLPGLDIKSFPYGVVVNGVDVRITWNCLGWQSFLLLTASMLVGFRGGYSVKSIIQTIILGFAGTFIINIFRIVFTAALVGWWSQLFAILFHNYFMTFVSIIWLLFFWWFAYRYILEDKDWFLLLEILSGIIIWVKSKESNDEEEIVARKVVLSKYYTLDICRIFGII